MACFFTLRQAFLFSYYHLKNRTHLKHGTLELIQSEGSAQQRVLKEDDTHNARDVLTRA